MTGQTQKGFTLVETMVAMMVFGMIAIAGVVVLRMAANSNEQLDMTAAAAGEFQVARSLIKTDLSQVVDRAARNVFGATQPGPMAGGNFMPGGVPVEEEGERLLLAFVANGNINPGGRYPRSTLQRVEYWVVNESRIVRRTSNYIDRTEDTPHTDRILFDGVDGVEMHFLSGPLWEDRWVSRGTIVAPPAIELTFDHPRYGAVRQLFYVGKVLGSATEGAE